MPRNGPYRRSGLRIQNFIIERNLRVMTDFPGEHDNLFKRLPVGKRFDQRRDLNRARVNERVQRVLGLFNF